MNFILHPPFRIAFMSFLSVLFLSACGGKGAAPLSSHHPPTETELARMGFVIQAGAFTHVDNAMELTQSLQRHGLDAYYFMYRSGLYKVRFGDFPTVGIARSRAEKLKSRKIINDYYIVTPDTYAVSQRRIHGNQYLREKIVKTALSFIGVPYQWGGSSARDGVDCSGLTMAVFQLNGLKLPHSSKEQYRVGRVVSRLSLKRGDLVFFATARGSKVSHVGIYTGKGTFVHAPGRGKKVRKDVLSNRYYKTRYRGARRYI